MDGITIGLIVFFLLLAFGFMAGLFLFPELLGISKKPDKSSDEEPKP